MHVDDVVDAIRRALHANLPAGTTLNIGTGHCTRIVDLTTRLLRMSGTDCVPVHDAPDWTAGSYRVADRRRADALLGWAPQGLLASPETCCGSCR